MDLPNFLRPEYVVPEMKEADEMLEAMERYEKEIGEDLTTEPSTYTDKEWVEMLNECIDRHITIWELWGVEHDENAYYW